MTKVDLIAKVAAEAELTKKDAEKAVAAVLDGITEALKAGDKVALVGFGTLLREFPKSSFKQEISARPAPFRPARRSPSRHPEGQQTYRKEHTAPRQTTGTVSYETIPVFFSAAYPARSGLECVDMQLERAFQVTGLVLVDDVVLAQLPYEVLLRSALKQLSVHRSAVGFSADSVLSRNSR